MVADFLQLFLQMMNSQWGGEYIGDWPQATGNMNYANIFFYDGQIGLHFQFQKRDLSTGPLYIDPAAEGVAGFNEVYYLRVNESAANAVSAGTYETGLAHYLAEGQASDLRIAANIGNDSINRIKAGQYSTALTGNGGADSFVFNISNTGDDVQQVITDFEPGSDEIDLTSFGITFSDLNLTSQQDSVLISFNALSIQLNGVTLESISNSDFSFE